LAWAEFNSAARVGEQHIVISTSQSCQQRAGDGASGVRQQIDRTFDRNAINPNVFCVTNSLALGKTLASLDRRCTLLPRFAVENEVNAGTLSIISVKEFTKEPLMFCVCELNSRSLSPAAKAFVDAIVDFCQRFGH
jgi:DNA-binding transcriptional LysR family regulator